MTDLLPFVVSGIAVGAVYGLAATGLVLTYKTSGIFNFGHGAVATAAAYVFYWLHVDKGLDWKLALAISVFGLGPLLGLAMERFAAKLAPQRAALKIVGTVGLILLVQGLATIKYGTTSIPVPQFLPAGRDSFEAFDVVITYDKVIMTAVAVVAVALLYALFRWTRLGLAMRAVVDDPDLLEAHGTDPRRVRRIAWIIGCTFAALSGVLVVPLIGLDAILLTFLVVQAFGAAAIGGFASIPLTLAGGVAVGIGRQRGQALRPRRGLALGSAGGPALPGPVRGAGGAAGGAWCRRRGSRRARRCSTGRRVPSGRRRRWRCWCRWCWFPRSRATSWRSSPRGSSPP